MSQTHRERILDYLWSVAPQWATNGEIRDATRITSHQQVYLLTQELLYTGRIQGQQRDREWVFRADESLAVRLTSPGRLSSAQARAVARQLLPPREFAALARAIMSQYLGVPLAPAQVPGVPQEFDLVAPDQRIVGEALYLAPAWGEYLPQAKFAVMAEYVWLLNQTEAPTRFLVLGYDQAAPHLWLVRYGHLAGDVAFYFLTDTGELEPLQEPLAPDFRPV